MKFLRLGIFGSVPFVCFATSRQNLSALIENKQIFIMKNYPYRRDKKNITICLAIVRFGSKNIDCVVVVSTRVMRHGQNM